MYPIICSAIEQLYSYKYSSIQYTTGFYYCINTLFILSIIWSVIERIDKYKYSIAYFFLLKCCYLVWNDIIYWYVCILFHISMSNFNWILSSIENDNISNSNLFLYSYILVYGRKSPLHDNLRSSQYELRTSPRYQVTKWFYQYLKTINNCKKK